MLCVLYVSLPVHMAGSGAVIVIRNGGLTRRADSGLGRGSAGSEQRIVGRRCSSPAQLVDASLEVGARSPVPHGGGGGGPRWHGGPIIIIIIQAAGGAGAVSADGAAQSVRRERRVRRWRGGDQSSSMLAPAPALAHGTTGLSPGRVNVEQCVDFTVERDDSLCVEVRVAESSPATEMSVKMAAHFLEPIGFEVGVLYSRLAPFSRPEVPVGKFEPPVGENGVESRFVEAFRVGDVMSEIFLLSPFDEVVPVDVVQGFAVDPAYIVSENSFVSAG